MTKPSPCGAQCVIHIDSDTLKKERAPSLAIPKTSQVFIGFPMTVRLTANQSIFSRFGPPTPFLFQKAVTTFIFQNPLPVRVLRSFQWFKMERKKKYREYLKEIPKRSWHRYCHRVDSEMEFDLPCGSWDLEMADSEDSNVESDMEGDIYA